MVFSNLQRQEKDAFFALLDEYFTSRPEVLSSITQASNNGSNNAVAGAAASAVQRAFASNPEAASKFVSAGLRHAAAAPSHSNATESDEAPSSVAGRIAAFSGRNSSTFSSSRSGPPPVSEKPTAFSGSGAVAASRNALASVYGSMAKNTSSSPSPPPAPAPAPSFTAKSSFTPPPVRSTQSTSAPPAPPAPPPPPAARRQEEQADGDWAEALYDYDSQEAGDLKIAAGGRVLVTDRTSDDWWTGEFEGKMGLFPASYVKLL